MGGAGILPTRIQFRWEQTQGFNTLSSPHPIPPLSLNFTGISHSSPVSWERPPRTRMESPKRWKRRWATQAHLSPSPLAIKDCRWHSREKSLPSPGEQTLASVPGRGEEKTHSPRLAAFVRGRATEPSRQGCDEGRVPRHWWIWASGSGFYSLHAGKA